MVPTGIETDIDAVVGLCWGSLEGAPLDALAAAAAATGIASITATPAMVFAAIGHLGSVDALRSAMDDQGVRVTMIDPLLRGLPGAVDASSVGRRWRSTFLHDEDDCHRAADAVGAELLNVAHFLGAPTARHALVDAIGAITERAAARGRRIAVEAMPEGAIPDVREAAAIVRAVAHASCGVTVDTWHWWRSGGDLAELEEMSPGAVFAVQLADAALDARGSGTTPPSRDRLLPGAGVLPLVEIVRIVRAGSPQAWLGLEVFDRSRPCADAADQAGCARAAVAAWRDAALR